MPDNPDYQKYLPGSLRFSLQDMSELAARLGSIHRYDRRGEYMYGWDGRDGLGGWTVAWVAANDNVTIASDQCFMSAYSMWLHNHNQVGSACSVRRSITGFDEGREGVEISFQPGNNAIRLDVNYYSSGKVNSYNFLIRVNGNGNNIQIRDHTGVMRTVLTVGDLVSNPNLFHVMKLVVDFDTGYYVRMMFDYTEVDLSMWRGIPSAPASPPLKRLELTCSITGEILANTYIGHVIITANEP